LSAELTIYVDADACPVKAETVRVAERHRLPVVFVANSWIQVPRGPRIRVQVVPGSFDAADDESRVGGSALPLRLSDWHKIFGQQSEVDMKQNHNPRPLEETRRYWPIMTAYERFEQIVAFLLGLLIAIVVVIALIQLLIEVMPLVLGGALDPLDHRAFQALFGMIMTLLIAMEFKHSIIRVALRRESVIQVKTVMLVALLALSRKFIILDVAATEPATIAALSGATLVLGIVYWLLRERDDRLAPAVRDPQADVG